EPNHAENRVGMKQVIVGDGYLHQEIGQNVSARTDAVTFGIELIAGKRVTTDKAPGVAVSESASEFYFADVQSGIFTSLRQLYKEIAAVADLARRREIIQLAIFEWNIGIGPHVP